MELSVVTAPASDEERAAVDAALGPPASGWEGGVRAAVDGHVALGGRRGGRRHLLLPLLHALQNRIGWISPEALGYVCTRLDIPPADAYGVATAYALFSLQPAPPVVVRVCDDVACRARAGTEAGGRTKEDGRVLRRSSAIVAWHSSPCLGHCEHGSAALVEIAGAAGGRATIAPFGEEESAALDRAVGAAGGAFDVAALPAPSHRVPQAAAGRPGLRLLRRVGQVNPASIDSYRAAGGYEALRRALELGPAGVLAQLDASGLLGRGGAAFPTGAKWRAVAVNPVHPHYVVANADESEPGTFKDRVLLEADPFALVEALTVMGTTVGAEKGFVYLRGEYPLACSRVEAAARTARARGFLGDDVMGSGLRFDIEVRAGAGAYVAGEETALFNSIEGRRPEPRNKPPFPAEIGLFGKPTGVNNVETLFCVLDVLTSGAASFAATGTASSTGTRLFCVSGRISVPGLYEVPLGTTLGELLDLAGGVREGRPLAGLLLGGAAGVFVGPDAVSMSLSFEGATAAGATLGSGVVVVLDDTVDVLGLLERIARFFRDESCGQCVPCRVGTARLEELLGRLVAGRTNGVLADELALLGDLDAVLRDASICGLGQTASSAVTSALRSGVVTLAPPGALGEAPR